jgi:hypothetical protein
MTLRTPKGTLVTIATTRREDVQNAERSGRLVTCEAVCKESMLAAATLRAEAAEAERDRLAAAVERVLALHEIFGDWCDRCNCVAPCATLRALEGTP